jgi:division protein CdvB (Snf7/Vps24/ESCRT-III family)
MFINELNLYVDYLKKDMENHLNDLSDKKGKYLSKFKNQLQNGIDYYKELIPRINNQTAAYLDKMSNQLAEAEAKLQLLCVG